MYGLLLLQPHGKGAVGRDRPDQSRTGHHQCREKHRADIYDGHEYQPSINKVDKKKNKHIISDRTNNITQDFVIKEFNNIETILKISKEKNIDFIKLLKQSIIVEEIKI